MESTFLFDSVPFVCYLDIKGSAAQAAGQTDTGTAEEKTVFIFEKRVNVT